MMTGKRVLWGSVLAVAAVVMVLALGMPAGSAAEHHEEEMTANHFKCYQVLDWGEWQPVKAELKDQFGASVARVIEPRLLCNPVDKNGEGIADSKSHLVCYEIADDPTGNTERVKEVEVRNQFQSGPLWVGSSNLLCVPSEKSYRPRG